MKYIKKLEKIKEEIENRKLDGYLVPSNNEYHLEYVNEEDNRLNYLTGFSGSNGLLLILKDKNIFFTDSRYTIQAKQELDNELFEIFDIAEKNYIKYLEEIKSDTKISIGFDSKLFSIKQVETFENNSSNIKWCNLNDINLVDNIWERKKNTKPKNIKLHYLDYSGQSSKSKRAILSKELKKNNTDAILITDPDIVCWLLNIRGEDVENTPIVQAKIIHNITGETFLFIDEKKVPKNIYKTINQDIILVDEKNNAIDLFIRNYNNLDIILQIDDSISYYYLDLLIQNNIDYVILENPCYLSKAIKNDIEIKGMIDCHIRDGIALTDTLYWLHNSIKNKDEISEIDVDEYLFECRKKQDKFVSKSFDTISAFAQNGAIVHYRANQNSNLSIKGSSLLLLDSGGQYLNGTTDVTRTIFTGTSKPKKELKNHFTLVLKGHLALLNITFPKNTTGAQLDVLARQHLWNSYLDYGHGTGHGVGSYLSVHEGPQAISKGNNITLKKGMVLSNEPGFYKEGEYGIRIENLMFVDEVKNNKDFLQFKVLTLAPIDNRLININMLNEQEIEWLNDYHELVFETISPYINDNNKQLKWLQKACAKL